MAKVIGKIKIGSMEWSKDFEATRIDDKSKYEASWSYNCHVKDIFKFMPATGASCVKEGWEFLQVSGLDVVSIIGVVVEINVKFNGFPEGEGSEFDDDSKYTIDESTTTTQEPVDTNPKFADITTERLILKRYKSGELLRDTTDPFKFYPAELEDGESAYFVEVTSEAGKKLLEYIDNGVEYYLKPQVTRRISWESKTKGTTTQSPGKIGTPRTGGDAVGVTNWLFVGLTINKTGKIYTHTEEWLGGDFDEYLYTAPTE